MILLKQGGVRVEIYERIKYLRKTILHLTQEEFVTKIKISRSNLGAIEIGRVNVTDRVISDICEKYNVNEVWLRTGEGGEENIFNKISKEDAYSISLGKLTKEENDFVKNAVNYLANAEPEKLKVIEDFMKKCLGIEYGE